MDSTSSIQLFCLPYAGSSAVVYARWKRRLPPWIEVVPVELPGRGSRMAEALVTSMTGLVEGVAKQVRRRQVGPFALFGHSLGALVAFELAHHLQSLEVDLPLVVMASGAHAPSRRNPERFASLNSDEELRAELERLDGTPRSVLSDPELMALTLPVLRADFAVATSYECTVGRRIRCPIHAFGGSEDETTVDSLLSWKDHSDAEFFMNVLPGGHFFVHTQEAELLRLIALRLQVVLGSRRRFRHEAQLARADEARPGQR